MVSLKTEREARNLTQKEAAKQIGVSYSTLTKLESGYRGASHNTMKKFSLFYHKSVDSLFFSSLNTESENTETDEKVAQ